MRCFNKILIFLAVFNPGRICFDKKDYARAKKEFEEALRIDPDYYLAKLAPEKLNRILTEI